MELGYDKLRTAYMSGVKQLLQRVLIILPWVFIIWIISQGFSGEMDGLLAFVLVIIFIPLAIALNLFTIVAFQGSVVVKRIRQIQKEQKRQGEPIKSTNYADLPWWHPKRWF